MKKKLKISLIILLLIAVGVSGWVFKNHEEEKEKEALYKEYKGIAYELHLELDESEYEQTNNPEDLILTATPLTANLLKRWQFISGSFSEVEYPDEAIDEEDWIEVHHTLDNQTYSMEEASIKIWEEFSDNRVGNHRMAVYYYIYENEVVADYFREFLKKNRME